MIGKSDGHRPVRLARPVVSATASAVVVLMFAFLVLVGGTVAVTLLRWWQVGDVPRLSVVSAGVGLLVVVVFGVAVLGRLTSSSLSLKRSRILPSSVSDELLRIQQAGVFGVGGLAGWTATNPAVAMSDLISPPPIEAVQRFLRLAAEDERGRPEPSGSAVAVAGASNAAGQARTMALPAANYEVARGDTYWLLAERAFGDGSRWAEVRELNLGRGVEDDVVIEEDTNLRRGWRIAVPVVENEEER